MRSPPRLGRERDLAARRAAPRAPRCPEPLPTAPAREPAHAALFWRRAITGGCGLSTSNFTEGFYIQYWTAARRRQRRAVRVVRGRPCALSNTDNHTVCSP
jgi:hypothetical protein